MFLFYHYPSGVWGKTLSVEPTVSSMPNEQISVAAGSLPKHFRQPKSAVYQLMFIKPKIPAINRNGGLGDSLPRDTKMNHLSLAQSILFRLSPYLFDEGFNLLNEHGQIRFGKTQP